MSSLSDLVAFSGNDEQLRQVQKMEALGRLAGGVAHDFNNLLTVILGCTEMLSARESDDTSLGLLEEIKTAGDRAALLTRQLLTFSRCQPAKPTLVDVNALVGELTRMLSRLIGEHIKLATYFDSHVRSVKADPGQLGQVLMNLAINARDAMPRGGRLTIATGRVELQGSELAKYPGARAGRFTGLLVEDSGCGMDQHTLSHLFEPFFTTKERGKGTGLGLATVYGIVKQFGGHIRVTSKPGRGTRFKILFPEGDEGPVLSKTPCPDADSLKADGGTILLVEDEAPLRRLFAQTLRERGYEVLEADSGHRALVLSRDHSNPLDLLVTDVVMPGLCGPKLAEVLSRERPGLKVLLMSGFTDSNIDDLDGGAADWPLLMKPFGPAELAEEVRRLVAGVPAQSEAGCLP